MEWRHIKPKTTGDDLKRLGLEPGPKYQTILRKFKERLAGWRSEEHKGRKNTARKNPWVRISRPNFLSEVSCQFGRVLFANTTLVFFEPVAQSCFAARRFFGD